MSIGYMKSKSQNDFKNMARTFFRVVPEESRSDDWYTANQTGQNLRIPV